MCLLRTIYLSINYFEPTFKAVDVEIKVSAASAGDICMPQASNKTLKFTQHFLILYPFKRGRLLNDFSLGSESESVRILRFLADDNT